MLLHWVCVFIQATNFRPSYKNKIFICEHGSWNRSKKAGYKVGIATLEGNTIVNYEPFADGFLQNGDKVIGQPSRLYCYRRWKLAG
jgi:glucose/arabinose dehydrogenase